WQCVERRPGVRGSFERDRLPCWFCASDGRHRSCLPLRPRPNEQEGASVARGAFCVDRNSDWRASILFVSANRKRQRIFRQPWRRRNTDAVVVSGGTCAAFGWRAQFGNEE